MDRIWLRGIDCRCRVGVPDEEREDPQSLLIDLGLELDLSDAGWNDEVRLTADYAAVEQAVLKLAEKGERRLVEALAKRVAELVLKSQPKVMAVTVVVAKKPAAMPRTREVAVEIRRERNPALPFEPDR